MAFDIFMNDLIDKSSSSNESGKILIIMEKSKIKKKENNLEREKSVSYAWFKLLKYQ